MLIIIHANGTVVMGSLIVLAFETMEGARDTHDKLYDPQTQELITLDDDFIKEVGDTVHPGQSALFLLARDVQTERVIDELESYAPTVLRTNLSPQQEGALREAFGAEGTAA